MSAHSERNSHRANGKVSSQNLRYDSAAIVRSASQAFHEQGGPLPEAIDTRRFQKNQRKVCTQGIPHASHRSIRLRASNLLLFMVSWHFARRSGPKVLAKGTGKSRKILQFQRLPCEGVECCRAAMQSNEEAEKACSRDGHQLHRAVIGNILPLVPSCNRNNSIALSFYHFGLQSMKVCHKYATSKWKRPRQVAEPLAP